MKLGVCLAGGGVKGAAHIGALKALKEKNIEIDCISGTSSGSIVATLYASGYSCEEILNIFKQYSKKIKYIDLKNIYNIIKKIIFEHKFVIEGFNTGEVIEKTIDKLCNNKKIYNINDIKNKLLIASVSLNNGKVYFFENLNNRNTYSDEIISINNINIGKAVRASCSFPGVFCPVKYNEDLLIDGGVRENVPWKEVKKRGIDTVLCIAFEEEIKNKKDKNIIDSISGAMNLISRELSNYELNGADYVLKIKTKEISLLDFKEIEYLYNLGYNKTKEYLEKYLLNNIKINKAINKIKTN